LVEINNETLSVKLEDCYMTVCWRLNNRNNLFKYFNKILKIHPAAKLHCPALGERLN